MQRVLDYASLGDLDGGILSKAVNLHLRKVVADCRDREGETKPRKIAIEVLIAPIPDQSGQADDVEVQCTVKSTIPVNRSRSYRMGIFKDDTARYMDDALDNPNQVTLPYRNGDDEDVDE